MANQLFARKPLALLLEEAKGENRLRRVLGPVQLTSLGVGAIIGTGIFVLTGVAAHDKTGPGAHAVLRGRGHRLHLRGPLLRGVRLDGAGGRLGLHLRLRHAGRAVRLDHRLGPRPRVRRRPRPRWRTAGRTTSRTSSASSAFTLPEGAQPTRPSTTIPRPGTSSRTGSLVDLPGHRHRRASSPCVLVKGIQESARFNAAMVVDQARGRALRHRRRAPSTSTPRTGSPFAPFG